MILKNKILALATLVLAAGCVEENLEAPAENPGNGETCISFRTSAPDLVMTKASEGDSRIENALIFVFNDQNVCVAKQWSYIGEDNKMYMYLPSGNINIYAVCNLLDPETVMNRVSDLDDLKNEALTISDWSEAYRGKYVMSGSLQSASKPADDGFLTINVQRVAAQFNVNISFSPVTFPDTEQFEISEVKIHYVPKGTWILPREDGDRPGLEKRDGIGDDIEESGNFSLEKSGCRNDWTYVEAAGDMAQKYFDSAVLTLEEAEAQTAEKWRYSTSFSIFENRRGILNKELSAGAASDPYAVNWPTLYQRDDDERAQYAQLWKKGLHDNVCAAGHEKNAGMEYATYLTISGVYIMSEDLKWETEYYIYLGSDNFSSFDVNRNYQYNMDIVIHTVDNADTRVDPEQIDGMRVYYNEETVLDAHCNSVKTLLYSSGDWEVWVKNPDETPWLELSTASDYKPLLDTLAKMGYTAVEAASYSDDGKLYGQDPAQFKADFSREAKSVRVSVCSIVKSGTETLLSDAVEETFSLSVAKVAFEKVSKAFFGDKYTLELTSDSILPCSLSLLISENFPPNDLTNFRSYLTIAPGELKPGETLKKSVQYSRRMKGKPLYFRLIATDRTAAKQVLVVPETRNIK